MSARKMDGDLRAHGLAALEAGRYNEALTMLRLAAAAAPDDQDIQHDLGCALQVTGDAEAARQVLSRALSMAPGRLTTTHALAFVLMYLGDYRAGSPLWDTRHLLGRPEYMKPALPFPEWQGEDPAGKKILLFPEQGLGDQMQFARFAPWLARRGAEVTLLCNPAPPQFAGSFGDVKVVAAQGAAEFDDPDYWVMVGSVVGRAGLGVEDVPNATYLLAVGDWPATTRRIGVAVQGNPGHRNDHQRSLDAGSAAALLALPGAVNLTPESTGARDFADTSALVAQLDLVITVDTSVAHLAAGMGKPTWILIPRHHTDWRWMAKRTDSPWYPSARLFRQAEPGDWTPVLAEVKDALGAFAASA